MSGRKRTHTCGELGLDSVGQHVVLMGWVETVRDLGGLIFIDLRDREGVTQILVNPEAGASVVETAKRVGSEWVIAVGGEVLERAKETLVAVLFAKSPLAASRIPPKLPPRGPDLDLT